MLRAVVAGILLLGRLIGLLLRITLLRIALLRIALLGITLLGGLVGRLLRIGRVHAGHAVGADILRVAEAEDQQEDEGQQNQTHRETGFLVERLFEPEAKHDEFDEVRNRNEEQKKQNAVTLSKIIEITGKMMVCQLDFLS